MSTQPMPTDTARAQLRLTLEAAVIRLDSMIEREIKVHRPNLIEVLNELSFHANQTAYRVGTRQLESSAAALDQPIANVRRAEIALAAYQDGIRRMTDYVAELTTELHGEKTSEVR